MPPLRSRSWVARGFAWATSVMCLASASTGLAADASARDDWYGVETLAADGCALVLFIAGVATNDRSTGQGVVVGSGVAYLVGGPLVHLLHRQELTSLGSLGLRAAGPVAGGLLGAALGGLAAYDDGNEVIRGTVYGVMGGLLGAVIVDAALLAWQPAQRSSREPAGSGLAWRPRFTLTETRAELGVMGSF
jgi:hypothetical protein